MSMDNYPLAAGDRGKYLCFMQKTFMQKRFREAFLQHLEATGTSVASVARGAGVSKDMLHKLKQGRTMAINVDDAIKIAAYFGQTVNEFVGGTREEIEDTLLRQIAQLSQAERKLLAASLRALLDARDQNGQEPGEDEATTSSDHHQTDRQ